MGGISNDSTVRHTRCWHDLDLPVSSGIAECSCSSAPRDETSSRHPAHQHCQILALFRLSRVNRDLRYSFISIVPFLSHVPDAGMRGHASTALGVVCKQPPRRHCGNFSTSQGAITANRGRPLFVRDRRAHDTSASRPLNRTTRNSGRSASSEKGCPLS
jgi:hypothetical protein